MAKDKVKKKPKAEAPKVDETIVVIPTVEVVPAAPAAPVVEAPAMLATSVGGVQKWASPYPVSGLVKVQPTQDIRINGLLLAKGAWVVIDAALAQGFAAVLKGEE